jgi:hypothetical protein
MFSSDLIFAEIQTIKLLTNDNYGYILKIKLS